MVSMSGVGRLLRARCFRSLSDLMARLSVLIVVHDERHHGTGAAALLVLLRRLLTLLHLHGHLLQIVETLLQLRQLQLLLTVGLAAALGHQLLKLGGQLCVLLLNLRRSV